MTELEQCLICWLSDAARAVCESIQPGALVEDTRLSIDDLQDALDALDKEE